MTKLLSFTEQWSNVYGSPSVLLIWQGLFQGCICKSVCSNRHILRGWLGSRASPLQFPYVSDGWYLEGDHGMLGKRLHTICTSQSSAGTQLVLVCLLAVEGFDESKGHENTVAGGRSCFYIKSYSFASWNNFTFAIMNRPEELLCFFILVFFSLFLIVSLIKHMRMTENRSVKRHVCFKPDLKSYFSYEHHMWPCLVKLWYIDIFKKKVSTLSLGDESYIFGYSIQYVVMFWACSIYLFVI